MLTRRFSLSLLAIVSGVFLALVAVPHARADEAKAPAGASAAVSKLTFTNEMVGDKKTWLPAKGEAKAGQQLQIVLVNKLKDPHGFQAPGLVAPVVVAGGETKTVVVDAPKAGTYKFNCQLHPAHVGGEITVK